MSVDDRLGTYHLSLGEPHGVGLVSPLLEGRDIDSIILMLYTYPDGLITTFHLAIEVPLVSIHDSLLQSTLRNMTRSVDHLIANAALTKFDIQGHA